MPPRRRKKVGLQRIDAVIDALKPMGYSTTLIRKTVKSLLEAYGGDDGWAFIEENSYTLLIETILEEEEKSKGGSNETKLLMEGGNKIDDSLRIELGAVHSPSGQSKKVDSSHIPGAMQTEILSYSLKDDISDGKDEVEVQSSQMQSSAQNQFLLTEGPTMPDDVTSSSKDEIFHIKPGKQLLASPQISSARIHSMRLCSPSPIDSRPKRKACYGWIDDSDDD